METQFSIALKSNQVLRGLFFVPCENPRAFVILVHGIGEHMKRYSAWAELFQAEGIGMVGVDLPGHGRSEGKRGHVKSYSVFREMINTLLDVTKKTYPGVPLFVYGHSLGGGIVLDYLLHENPEIKGAVVTSPWLKLAFEPSLTKQRIAGWARKIVPSLVQPTGLIVSYISHDRGVIEEYQLDPLVHNKISVSLFNETIESAKYSMANAADLKVPLLIVHGSEDMITSPQASIEFAQASPNTEIRIWEGGFHELHNEPFKKEVFEYILSWMNNRLN